MSLGNKEIMAKNIRRLMDEKGVKPADVCRALGFKPSSFSDWIHANTYPRIDKIEMMANYFGVLKSGLVEENSTLPSNGIPYKQTGLAPIVGSIPAGIPSIADCVIEGYAAVDVSAPEEYYWLRVNGDSMVNAGIQTGDLVLIHVQSFAETGQIVACRVNGDEATLKRYRQKDDQIFLIPENPNYEPYILKTSEFETGRAAVMGVAVEIKRFL